jgi:hypothetical protein
VIYLAAVLAGIVAAVVGWFVTGAVTVWIAGLYGMSDFEGGRGMFAFLGIGPIGGLVSMIVAIWLVLRAGKGRVRLGPMLARVGLVLGAIAAVVAGGIGIRFLTLSTYTNELPPDLEFEIRLPASMAAPERADVRIELHTDRNVAESLLTDPWLRVEDDHRLIGGIVPLAMKTSGRLLVVWLPGEPTRLFRLQLSRDPASTTTLGEWHHADHLDRPGSGGPVAAPKDDPVELRYRVRRAGED